METFVVCLERVLGECRGLLAQRLGDRKGDPWDRKGHLEIENGRSDTVADATKRSYVRPERAPDADMEWF